MLKKFAKNNVFFVNIIKIIIYLEKKLCSSIFSNADSVFSAVWPLRGQATNFERKNGSSDKSSDESDQNVQACGSKCRKVYTEM